MGKKYLLEIGMEELPAKYVENTMSQIKEKLTDLFSQEEIKFEEIKTYSTPRRLVVLVDGLEEKQADSLVEVKGPSKDISFDEDGNPTKALLGFMRGQKVDLNSIFIKEINNVDYTHARLVKRGKELEEILKLELAKLIKSITFPKSMKWGGKDIRFARPIRWIVSILDDKIIAFDFEGIEVSNITRGHRFLGKTDIRISNIDEYFKLLEDNYVLLDGNKRMEIIKYGAEKLAKEVGGKLHCDKDLLDEVTNLVEYPTPILGRIKKEYLNLPKDVLITPMKEHLRYFPVLDDRGRLLPYFITVRNGNQDYIDTVIKGNEKVLGARLEDAKFFFNEDISYPLEHYTEFLKDIVFQDKLGSLYDKTKRIAKLSERISEYLGVGEETKKNVARASALAKNDLVTKMVTEFTELQGKMGMEYAHISGENEIVSLAIYEQYLPRFAGDDLPSTTAGSILSIADKLDTICGLFAIGIHPTGSQDPFALRRGALGIINIILDKRLDLQLMELIESALYMYIDENSLAFDYNVIKLEIMDFFVGRIKNIFADKGVRYDLIDSVINRKTDNIYDIKLRIEKISPWLDKEGLSDILTAFNRVSSLAIKTDSDTVKRDLLESEEINLYDSYNKIEEKVHEHISKREYDKALDLLVTLKDPIDNFFDQVMVMVEDEELRNNRLGLLRKIYNSMLMVCDLSKIMSK